MGFEPAATEFRLEAPTDRAIRHWVQLGLRANFVQLLQFQFFVQCSHVISVIVSVSRQICSKPNVAQVITLVAEWIDIYGIHHWRNFEVAIENWAVWGLSPRPLNSVQVL